MFADQTYSGMRAEALRFLPITFRMALIAAMVSTALSAVQASAQVTFTQTAIASGETSSDSIVSGDFNNDGILDLVTINSASLSFYKGLGGGKYAAPINQSLPPQTAGGFGQLFAADFNGDGKLDLASAYGATCCFNYGPVTILMGNGDGTFRQGTNIAVSGNATTIALADFNGDHKPDIAVSDDQTNMTWIYLGKGDGTFTLSGTQPYGGSLIVAGDFNADGKQDLAFTSIDGVGVFLGNGNGTISAPVQTSLYDVVSLAVGDFYNNRIQTLAALEYAPAQGNTADAYIYSLRYDNGMLYLENPNFIGNFSSGPNFLAAGDLNGDFKFDILLAGFSSYSHYMLGNGNGTFQALQNAPNNGATSYQNPIIRDLNLDSRHDIGMAWYASTAAGVEILLNTNAATNCTPPPANKLGVHICAPTIGQTVGTSFTFKAAGNAFNGIAKRMELWIDNKKVGQNLEDQLKVTTTLTTGKHTASFVVVESFDNYASSSVSFTVK